MANPNDLVDSRLVDARGLNIGTIKALYAEQGTNHLTWALVQMGRSTWRMAYLGPNPSRSGDAVKVQWEKQHVIAAPPGGVPMELAKHYRLSAAPPPGPPVGPPRPKKRTSARRRARETGRLRP